MKFSINVYKHILGFSDTYRLKKDGDWKAQQDFKNVDFNQDMLFDTLAQAESWKNGIDKIVVNGVELNFRGDADDGRIYGTNKFDIEIVVHRLSKPSNPIFTKEQVAEVLIKGNDNYHNSLVVDYHGYPHLIRLINRTPVSITEYPVRFETFNAGNEYVGHESRLTHLDGTYMALLETWYLHLNTGQQFYCDYVSGDKSEDELVQGISFITSSLT